MRKLILLALFAGLVVAGGYALWMGYFNASPAMTTLNTASSNGADAGPTLANPTIKAAVLNKDGIPETIGTLTLSSSTTGADVMAEFEQMHGKSFDLKSGFRADYVDGTAKATLWVGQAQSAAAAQAFADDMATKIGSGNAMFSNLQNLNISNRTLYEVSGLGQSHFFYAMNDKLVWLATDPDHAPDALHSIWASIQ